MTVGGSDPTYMRARTDVLESTNSECVRTRGSVLSALHLINLSSQTVSVARIYGSST